MTNRILPETLPALYEKHGVVPRQGDYGSRRDDGRRYACGIGICYLDAVGAVLDRAQATDRRSEASRALRLDLIYHSGYLCGFDSLTGVRRESLADVSETWQLGFMDGAAGWAAVKDLAVAE